MIIALLVLILLAILFPGLMRAVFLGLVALFMLALVLAPAHAGDGPPLGFPEFDVERNCEKLFRSNNGLFNQCVQNEEYGYRVLWSIWPSIPDEVRTYCVSITSGLLSNDKSLVNNLYAGVADCVFHQKAKYDSEHPNQPKRRFAP